MAHPCTAPGIRLSGALAAGTQTASASSVSSSPRPPSSPTPPVSWTAIGIANCSPSHPCELLTIAPVLGGYALLWPVFAGCPGSIGQRTDLSYGLCLYGWPIQNPLACLLPSLNPWTLTLAPLPIAAAYLGWIAVERPAMRHSRPPEPTTITATAD